VIALVCLAIGVVAVMPSAASASTGGTGEATGVELDVGALTIEDVPILPGLTATLAQATALPPDENGNSAYVDTVTIGAPPVLDATVIGAQVVRTTGGLTASSEITDLSVDLLGVEDLVAAEVITSLAVCPIDGVGTPSADATVTGLTIAGSAASVGATDVPVDVDLGVGGVVESGLYVSITQVVSEGVTGADATAVRVTVDLVVDFLVLPDIDLTLLELDLAQSSCTVPLGIAPTAASLAPTSGPEGTVVAITGTGFIPGATTVDIAGETVPADAVTVSDVGTTASFTVPADAPVGPTTVVATTPAGSTGPLVFEVTPPPPTALSLTPDEGPSGVTVTVLGSDFVPSATTVGFGALTIAAPDVTVAPDGASLTFLVPDGAPLGPTAVHVATPAGTSGDLSFTVTEMPAVPTVTGLDPDEGPVGTVVEVTGTDLVPGGTSVDVGGTVVPATEVAVSPDGTTATFIVPDGLPLGPASVSVTTPAGTADAPAFLVTAGVAPTATGITPAEGPAGTVVTLIGTGFVPGATTVQFGTHAIAAALVTVGADGTTATFTVPAGAPVGQTSVTATTPDGTSSPQTFTVTAPAPAPPVRGGGTLPYTGGGLPLALAGAGLLVVGAVALGFGRVARARRQMA